jgi:hypothetical protein
VAGDESGAFAVCLIADLAYPCLGKVETGMSDMVPCLIFLDCVIDSGWLGVEAGVCVGYLRGSVARRGTSRRGVRPQLAVR